MEMLSDASSTLAISTIAIKKAFWPFFIAIKEKLQRVELDEHGREAKRSSGAVSRPWPSRPEGEASGGRLRKQVAD